MAEGTSYNPLAIHRLAHDYGDDNDSDIRKRFGIALTIPPIPHSKNINQGNIIDRRLPIKAIPALGIALN
jgi:hypothetical protein